LQLQLNQPSAAEQIHQGSSLIEEEKTQQDYKSSNAFSNIKEED